MLLINTLLDLNNPEKSKEMPLRLKIQDKNSAKL
jgi:hypothetical protein